MVEKDKKKIKTKGEKEETRSFQTWKNNFRNW